MRTHIALSGKETEERRQALISIARKLGALPRQCNPYNCDLLLTWGVHMRSDPDFRQALRDGMVLVNLDRGYFDEDRMRTFSVSVQGVHGQSMRLPTVLDLPPRPHPPLQMWKTAGDFVQIIAPGWNGKFGWSTPAGELPEGWVTTTAAQASHQFGIPAKIRYHPRAYPGDQIVKRTPLESTFDETYVSVNYCSLSGVQTVIAGIPTVTLHPRSVAWRMSATDMRVYTPDREAWIHDLSHRVYRWDETEEASNYIFAAYHAAKEKGPLQGPLGTYGIRRE